MQSRSSRRAQALAAFLPPRADAHFPARRAQDKSFTLELKTPPASFLLKDRAGVKAGSAKGQKVKVGKVTAAQVEEIAKIKMPDLNCNGDLAAAVSIIKGSARNMGIEVV